MAVGRGSGAQVPTPASSQVLKASRTPRPAPEKRQATATMQRGHPPVLEAPEAPDAGSAAVSRTPPETLVIHVMSMLRGASTTCGHPETLLPELTSSPLARRSGRSVFLTLAGRGTMTGGVFCSRFPPGASWAQDASLLRRGHQQGHRTSALLQLLQSS